MINAYKGWAVLYRWNGKGEKPFLIGRYFWPGEIPPHMGGHEVAVFKTRREARAALAKRGTYGRGTVVRVMVSVGAKVRIGGKDRA